MKETCLIFLQIDLLDLLDLQLPMNISSAPSQAAPIFLQETSPEANTAGCAQSIAQAQVQRARVWIPVRAPESDLLVLISCRAISSNFLGVQPPRCLKPCLGCCKTHLQISSMSPVQRHLKPRLLFYKWHLLKLTLRAAYRVLGKHRFNVPVLCKRQNLIYLF